MIEKNEVVLGRLAEADARIQHDAVAWHARMFGGLEALAEKRLDLKEHVLVRRVRLHGFGRALHVHENDGSLGLRRKRKHFLIEPPGAHVV